MSKIGKKMFFSLKILITALILLVPVGLTLAMTEHHENVVEDHELPPAGETKELGFEPMEVVSMRNELSKTFDNGDGSYKAVLYLAPIHYQDGFGNWLEIDESQPLPGSRSRDIGSLNPSKDTMISTIVIPCASSRFPGLMICYLDTI